MKNRVNRTAVKKLLAAACLVCMSGWYAWAEDGYSIMKAMDDKDTPSTTHALVKLELVDEKGNTSERIIEQWGMTEGDKSGNVIVFHSPASVKNSRFLILSEKGKGDGKWIFLPALKKVRRIAASEGNSSFMGTEFTYDDMSSREIDDYQYTLLGEENFDGRPCYKIESVAKPGVDSSYAKTVSWIVKDPDVLTVLKIEMYGSDGSVVKVFHVEDLQKVDGFWVPMAISMKNLGNGKETKMIQQRLELNARLNTSLFTTRFLETGKAN